MTYPDITQLPDPPNRQTDNSTVFSNKTDTLLSALQPFVDDVNAAGDYFDDTIAEAENLVDELSNEITGVAESAALSASQSSASASDSQTYANTSVMAAASVAETQAVVNGILGLGIGTAYTDSEGNLLMPWDDGVLATAPFFDAQGNLLIEVTVV